MSIHVSSYVWKNSEQRGTSLLLLLAVADFANDEGVAFPGVERLAKMARIDVRGAQRHIKKLVEAGELAVDVNNGIQTQTGFTNRYYIIHYRRSVGIDSEELSNPKGEAIQSSDGVAKSPGVAPEPPLGVVSTPPLGVAPEPPKPSVEPSVEPPVGRVVRIDDIPPQNPIYAQYTQYIGRVVAYKEKVMIDEAVELYSEQIVRDAIQTARGNITHTPSLNYVITIAKRLHEEKRMNKNDPAYGLEFI